MPRCIGLLPRLGDVDADGLSPDDGSAASRLLEALVAFVRSAGERWSVQRIAEFAAIAVGDRAEVGDASQYVFHRARREGYDLPPFPLAGCGEIRRFLVDEGVRNLPEWYAKIGIEGEAYVRLHEKTLVSVRSSTGMRTVLLIVGLLYDRQAGFVPLAESDLVRRLDEEELMSLMEFVLSGVR